MLQWLRCNPNYDIITNQLRFHRSWIFEVNFKYLLWNIFRKKNFAKGNWATYYPSQILWLLWLRIIQSIALSYRECDRWCFGGVTLSLEVLPILCTLNSIKLEVWHDSLYLDVWPRVYFFDWFILFSQCSDSTTPEWTHLSWELLWFILATVSSYLTDRSPYLTDWSAH